MVALGARHPTFSCFFRVDFYPPRKIRANHENRWGAGLPVAVRMKWRRTFLLYNQDSDIRNNA